MASLLRVGMVWYSRTCLAGDAAACLFNDMCSCPCHSITPAHDLHPWKVTPLGSALLHLAFSYPRSPVYDSAFASAQKATQPDIQST